MVDSNRRGMSKRSLPRVATKQEHKQGVFIMPMITLSAAGIAAIFAGTAAIIAACKE